MVLAQTGRQADIQMRAGVQACGGKGGRKGGGLVPHGVCSFGAHGQHCCGGLPAASVPTQHLVLRQFDQVLQPLLIHLYSNVPDASNTQRPILVDLGWMRLCSLWLVLQAENTDGVSAMPSVDSTRLDNLVLEITGWSCKFVRNHSADGAFWTGHAGCCV